MCYILSRGGKKFEDTKRVITSHKSRGKNTIVKKWTRKKNTQKTKDWATQSSLKARDQLMCSIRVSRSCSTSGTRRLALVENLVMKDERKTGLWIQQTELNHGHMWQRYSLKPSYHVHFKTFQNDGLMDIYRGIW